MNSIHNKSNCGRRDKKRLSDVANGVSSLVHFANFAYIILRKNCAAVCRAFMVPTTVLCFSVLIIVSKCPDENVIWIAALPIVAFMASAHIIWDVAFGQYVRDSLRPIVDALESNLPISAPDNRTFPRPTFIGPANINLAPKNRYETIRDVFSVESNGFHSPRILVTAFKMQA